MLDGRAHTTDGTSVVAEIEELIMAMRGALVVRAEIHPPDTEALGRGAIHDYDNQALFN